jgi:hypothetical protein
VAVSVAACAQHVLLPLAPEGIEDGHGDDLANDASMLQDATRTRTTPSNWVWPKDYSDYRWYWRLPLSASFSVVDKALAANTAPERLLI